MKNIETLREWTNRAEQALIVLIELRKEMEVQAVHPETMGHCRAAEENVTMGP